MWKRRIQIRALCVLQKVNHRRIAIYDINTVDLGIFFEGPKVSVRVGVRNDYHLPEIRLLQMHP